MSEGTIALGALVREKGKRKIMTVTGDAGLAAHGTRSGNGKVAMPHKVVCQWRTAKGALRSAAFPVTALELAPVKQ